MCTIAKSTHVHACEQRGDPSGRCQYLGHVPLGALSTVSHPWGHTAQTSMPNERYFLQRHEESPAILKRGILRIYMIAITDGLAPAHTAQWTNRRIESYSVTLLLHYRALELIYLLQITKNQYLFSTEIDSSKYQHEFSSRNYSQGT
jgi:hypothetical protein